MSNWSKYYFFRSTEPTIIKDLLKQFRKTYHLQKHLSAVLCSNAAARRHYKNHRNKRKNKEDETDTVIAFTSLTQGENNPQKLLLQWSHRYLYTQKLEPLCTVKSTAPKETTTQRSQLKCQFLKDFFTDANVNVAKCNLGKVNLELMLPAVSPSLHMIRGGAPLEFAGANYVQPCLLAIVAITASVSESLRIH